MTRDRNRKKKSYVCAWEKKSIFFTFASELICYFLWDEPRFQVLTCFSDIFRVPKIIFLLSTTNKISSSVASWGIWAHRCVQFSFPRSLFLFLWFRTWNDKCDDHVAESCTRYHVFFIIIVNGHTYFFQLSRMINPQNHTTAERIWFLLSFIFNVNVYENVFWIFKHFLFATDNPNINFYHSSGRICAHIMRMMFFPIFSVCNIICSV